MQKVDRYLFSVGPFVSLVLNARGEWCLPTAERTSVWADESARTFLKELDIDPDVFAPTYVGTAHTKERSEFIFRIAVLPGSLRAFDAGRLPPNVEPVTRVAVAAQEHSGLFTLYLSP